MALVLAVSGLIILLACPASCLAKDTLTFGNLRGPVSFLSAQILTHAYKQINIDVNIVEFPPARSLVQSNLGKVDGEVNRIKGIEDAYPDLVMVPTPVNTVEAVVFSKNHRFEVQGWQSLKPYTIAFRMGIKFAEKGTRGMKAFKFVTDEKAFSLVAHDRYDVCIASRLAGLIEIQRRNLTGIKALEPPLQKIRLYHYLHKKHKDLIPTINSVLEAMHRQGRIKLLREQFIRELPVSYPETEQR